VGRSYKQLSYKFNLKCQGDIWFKHAMLDHE
jgi:hypothetical protein